MSVVVKTRFRFPLTLATLFDPRSSDPLPKKLIASLAVVKFLLTNQDVLASDLKIKQIEAVTNLVDAEQPDQQVLPRVGELRQVERVCRRTGKNLAGCRAAYGVRAAKSHKSEQVARCACHPVGGNVEIVFHAAEAVEKLQRFSVTGKPRRKSCGLKSRRAVGVHSCDRDTGPRFRMALAGDRRRGVRLQIRDQPARRKRIGGCRPRESGAVDMGNRVSKQAFCHTMSAIGRCSRVGGRQSDGNRGGRRAAPQSARSGARSAAVSAGGRGSGRDRARPGCLCRRRRHGRATVDAAAGTASLKPTAVAPVCVGRS